MLFLFNILCYVTNFLQSNPLKSKGLSLFLSINYNNNEEIYHNFNKLRMQELNCNLITGTLIDKKHYYSHPSLSHQFPSSFFEINQNDPNCIKYFFPFFINIIEDLSEPEIKQFLIILLKLASYEQSNPDLILKLSLCILITNYNYIKIEDFIIIKKIKLYILKQLNSNELELLDFLLKHHPINQTISNSIIKLIKN